MALERITFKVPNSFDPDKHPASKLVQVIPQDRGTGWEVESFEPDTRVATATRQTRMTQVRAEDDTERPKALRVSLPAGTKPTDGDKFAAKMADAHPGYHLVEFKPFVGQATLALMTEPELHCRYAVAVALGVKAWDVMCQARPDGGFSLRLPGAYVPSKHDTKLQEVAEAQVGKFGWYVQVDPKTLVAQVIPSEPPTFPEMIPLDLAKLGAGDQFRTAFGLRLPPPGQRATEAMEIDWQAQSWGMLSGTPGSGKTVTLCDIIADQVAKGASVAIVDEVSKSVDFLWAKSFVRDGGWGCDGLRSAITTLALIYAEGQRRASILKELGEVNWLDLPEHDRFQPIFVVVDEVSALLVTERLPAGVDKRLPEVQEIIEENRLRFKLQRLIFKIIAEQRFVGVRMILSTQVTNNNTGLPPTMKALIGHKILQGSNPSKSQRDQAFSVAQNVPEVPDNLRGGGLAAKGVGAAELEAQAPSIYKSFFAKPEAIASRLRALGCPTTSRPEPTEAEMDLYCPVGDIDEDEDAEPLVAGERLPSGAPVSSLDPRLGPGPASHDENGKPLKGAAAAAHASRQVATAGPLCPSCGRPIQPNGDCGCS